MRLMTIHRAKGLEFATVCVADLGRSRAPAARVLRVSADGRPGPAPGRAGRARARLGARLRRDRRGARRAEEVEERRLFYVAMTRARERLILSGATRFEGWTGAGRPAAGRWPGSRRRSFPSRAAARPRAAASSGWVARGSALRIAAARGRRRRGAPPGPPRLAAPPAVAAGRPPAAAAAPSPARAAGEAPAAGRHAELLGARRLRALRLPVLRRTRARAAAGAGAPTRRPRAGRARRADAPAAPRSALDRGMLIHALLAAAELPPPAAARRRGGDGGRGPARARPAARACRGAGARAS